MLLIIYEIEVRILLLHLWKLEFLSITCNLFKTNIYLFIGMFHLMWEMHRGREFEDTGIKVKLLRFK